MRRENLPANELMGRRMESGVLAVLGQLRATRNWNRIGREWWFADEPATELGREEWAYFESRGQRRVREVQRARRRLAGARLERHLEHDADQQHELDARDQEDPADPALEPRGRRRRAPRSAADRPDSGPRKPAPVTIESPITIRPQTSHSSSVKTSRADQPDPGASRISDAGRNDARCRRTRSPCEQRRSDTAPAALGADRVASA